MSTSADEYAAPHPPSCDPDEADGKDILAPAQKLHRITADLSPDAYSVLSMLAAQQNASKAEILRRSLSLYRYILQEKKEGNRILVEEESGRAKEIVTLY